jgi:2-hydroxy-6-oxonona-2,4-dienedioate hydrolase
MTRMGQSVADGPRAAIARFGQRYIGNLLPRVQAPTLVVRGARERIVPERWAREAAALLPRGRYSEVPGGRINYTTPGPFVRRVRAFLADCRAP